MTKSTGVGRGAPGRPKTPEHVAKVAAALKGRPLSDEHREAVSRGTARAVAPGTPARERMLAGQDTRLAARGQVRTGRAWYRENMYATVLERQGGVCGICGRAPDPNGRRFHIDHDHKCHGPKHYCDECVRGVLCASCNRILGLAMDDPVILERAAEWLR